MRRVIYGLSALIFSSAIAATVHAAHAANSAISKPVSQIAQQTAPQTAQTDFTQHFQTLGVEGSILIYDQNQDRAYQYNPDRNHTQFLPASTFKILNSLIALETGVIPNDIAVFTWDGIERSDIPHFQLAHWVFKRSNKNHSHFF